MARTEVPETKPGAGLSALAGLPDGGRTPRPRTPIPLLPGWAEASTQDYSQAYVWACLPGSWLCRALRALSSFALIKASLGAFSAGAILSDSMFSRRSSPACELRAQAPPVGGAKGGVIEKPCRPPPSSLSPSLRRRMGSLYAPKVRVKLP